MSGSPLSIPSLSAAEALGGGAMALWRQAQAQMAQQAAPLAPASEAHQEAAQPVAPGQPAAQQPATPIRLSELRLDATHLAHTLPPDDAATQAWSRWRHGGGRPPSEDETPREQQDGAAHPPEHWLVSLARRWAQAESLGALRSLQIARTQWASGRRVLLVCGTRSAALSAGSVTEAPAWAALLAGRPGPSGLVLEGPRWPVRLMWPAAPPASSRWFCARMVKEAAPGQSWQMKPCPEPGEAKAVAALQIGPVLESERRWSQLGVRLEGGSAFRAALGSQWSLWLTATRGCWMDD